MAINPEMEAVPGEVLDVLDDAVAHYIDSLMLPDQGPVLFITDKQNMDNKDVLSRRALTFQLASTLRQQGHPREILYFDEAATYDDFYSQVGSALDRLHGASPDGTRLTAVYIGDQWSNRGGLYDRLALFSDTLRHVSAAVSVKANAADIIAMSRVTPETLERVSGAIDYYREFFRDHPVGHMVVETEFNGETARLVLGVDARKGKAKIEYGRGVLDDRDRTRHKSNNGHYIYNFDNVLGAEAYTAPNPYGETNGAFFSKEGIYFIVEDGFIVEAYNYEDVYDQLEPRQQTVIDILKERVRLRAAGDPYEHMKMSLSEFGMGAFDMAGIKDLPPGCSTLFMEKLRIHFGVGLPASETNEYNAIAKIADAHHFWHDDFVTPENTKVVFVSPEDEVIPFYPHAIPEAGRE